MFLKQQSIDQSLGSAENGDLETAHKQYQIFHDSWFTIEEYVKADSSKAYTYIESNMGQVEFAFLQKKQPAIVDALRSLKSVLDTYKNGQYPSGTTIRKESITLLDFIQLLDQTKDKYEKIYVISNDCIC